MVTKNAAKKVNVMIGNSRPGIRIIANGIQARMGIGRSTSRIGKVRPKKIRFQPIMIPMAIPDRVATKNAMKTL